MRDDEFADRQLIHVADVFAGESRRIRILQALVLGFGALVVGTLLYLLCVAIDRGFNGHLKSTEQILVKVSSSLAAVPSSAAPSMVDSAATLADTAEPQLTAEKSQAKSEGTPIKQPAASASSAEASLHELLSTGVKAIASTTVAVIWVLVIAITVITISIARAVLLLKPQGLESNPPNLSRALV